MVENSQHAPSPTGRGVYWAIKEDWSRPAILGLLFVALTLVVISPLLYIADRDQKESFRVAMLVLRDRVLREVPIQQNAVLWAKDGVFEWSTVIWEKIDDEFVPRLFEARVEKGRTFLVTEYTVSIYDLERAKKLGLYEEVHPPK